jgi:hypothetical protein
VGYKLLGCDSVFRKVKVGNMNSASENQKSETGFTLTTQKGDSSLFSGEVRAVDVYRKRGESGHASNF